MKCKYNFELVNIKKQYTRMVKQKKYNVDRFKYYSKMQKLLHRDPDTYFDQDYNWYYSGGNLDVSTKDDGFVVVYSENSTNLCKYEFVR